MRFADLKNDFVFRRVFGKHPTILKRLLNDVLERDDEQTIDEIEYLPSEQVPLFEGLKLSILDVRCKDRSGTTFVVEMQLIHHPGFLKRIVYNASKAYVSQLDQGESYTKLSDVVAIAISNFELWPDAKQAAQNLPPVPMLSHWNIMERQSKTHDLMQVRYAFLELPKLPQKRPEKPGVELWAWLFLHGRELTEIPADLVKEPYGEALALANEAQFTPAEHDAYRRSFDEAQQVIEIANDRFARGKLVGKLDGERQLVLRQLGQRFGVLPVDARARVEAASSSEIDAMAMRVLTAATLEEVLDKPGTKTSQ